VTAQPNLYVVGGHAVDGDTGEVVTLAGLQAEIAALKTELDRRNKIISGLHRDVEGWAVRHRQAVEDKAQEAREHPCWPVGGLLFVGWRRLCNHPRSPWTPPRFWVCEPFLTSPHYGKTLTVRVELCARAVKGAAYDPWVKQRKNGTTERMDDWEKWIFHSSGKFEDFCCRAPRDWQPTLGPKMLAAIETAETLLENQRKARRAK
jgi:hypothetical protein